MDGGEIVALLSGPYFQPSVGDLGTESVQHEDGDGLDIIETTAEGRADTTLTRDRRSSSHSGSTGELRGPIRSSAGPIRSSARPISAARGTVLDRAKSRKASLREGECSNPSNLARKWNCKKVAAMSERCGVKLTELEAEELHKFILQG